MQSEYLARDRERPGLGCDRIHRLMEFGILDAQPGGEVGLWVEVDQQHLQPRACKLVASVEGERRLACSSCVIEKRRGDHTQTIPLSRFVPERTRAARQRT